MLYFVDLMTSIRVWGVGVNKCKMIFAKKELSQVQINKDSDHLQFVSFVSLQRSVVYRTVGILNVFLNVKKLNLS